MRTGLTPSLIAVALLVSAGPAAAACRCVCYQGRAEPRCTVGDLTPPICQNLCLDSAAQAPIRGVLDRPLAGGGQVLDSVTPSDPNWQVGPERGAYAYGTDPATGNAPTGAPGAAASPAGAGGGAGTAGIGR